MDQHAVDVEPDPIQFPNTIKRQRPSATQQPDPTTGDESVAGDVDTCRICRGEGTAAEPLFYPCKCSGSIKYVHQDCLMEWLSHSQKKHCELCKTPFRFTKLYSPNMPQRLPFYVFASHMAKYLFRNVLVWLRAALVISVWLGWLPYLMRSVWSFLFWISDEGFGPASHHFSRTIQNTTATHIHAMASTVISQGLTTTICPSSPLYPAMTTSANSRDVAEQGPDLLRALGWPTLNTTASNSIANLLARIVFGEAAFRGESTAQVSFNGTHLTPRFPQHDTLLSEVSFLKNLTPHPAVNRIMIQVFEGQIITILVIVCFILIILVRDYVVQQQPEIIMRADMRAAFAAQMGNPDDAQDLQPEQDQDLADQPPAGGPTAAAVEEHHAAGETLARDDESTIAQDDGQAADYLQAVQHLRDHAADELQQRPIAGFRRRLARRGSAEQDVDRPLFQGGAAAQATPRDSLDETRAELLRASLDGQSQSTVNQYLRIYREADGDWDEILKRIHDEGLEDRLSYWVNATNALARSKSDQDHGDPHGPPIRFPVDAGSSDFHADQDTTDDEDMPWSYPSPAPTEEAEVSTAPKGKGKEKATVDDAQDEVASSPSVLSTSWLHPEKRVPGGLDDRQDTMAALSVFDAPASQSSSRPRAVSDGPPIHDTINPLANNSWSFSKLPSNVDHGIAEDFSVLSTSGADVPSDPRDDGSTSPSGTALEAASPSADAGVQDDTDDPTPLQREAAQPTEPAGVPAEHLDLVAEAQGLPQTPSMADRIADFMWGNIEAGDGAGPDAIELFIDDQNAPFVDAHRDHDDSEEEDDIDDDNANANDVGPNGLAPDVVEAAAAAGIDPEAIDDAEDFDGIMELIGMRGPVAGLFQNAIFCAFLVSITIFIGIFLPYNIGRLAVWIVANPMRLLRMVFSFSRLVQDLCLLAVGWTSSFVCDLLYIMAKLFRLDDVRQFVGSVSAEAKHLTTESLSGLWDSVKLETTFITSNEIRNFSVVSHEALISVKHHIQLFFTVAGRILVFIFGGDYVSKWASTKLAIRSALPGILQGGKNVLAGVLRPGSWTVSLRLPETAVTFDPALAYWSAKDRTLAIASGYISLTVVAGLYLSRGTPFSSSRTAQEWEGSILDALTQASGVMKVILIISIEMLVFPLYCGLLLDFALLPLFESTSLRSRLLFTYNYPLTSIFVHWFVGTGYMFHFALFVSMCRKIMRKGVLYFIRDPDDPEFHPVRDVLERNVTTQLRKILFSAFVYGALVVVCLGGVVWGLSLALPTVLPIHYSSNEPVLEFPIDLLFYNFLMPLAVKFFRPSDGLHAMYTWWFRRCARALSLTWFLFGERRIDEEGSLRLPENSEHSSLPWYRKVFLEVGQDDNVVPKTWADTFEGGKSKPTTKIRPEDMLRLGTAKARLVNTGQLIPTGRFVRAPASDQVKIPKGRSVFLEVSDQDKLLDGRTNRLETDLYSNKTYQFVYVPPWFRVRIFMFIFFIWLFAAVTGVGFTIVPLVFGRRMFKTLIPAHIRTNDIYAFSIGIYILGSVAYLASNARSTAARAWGWCSTSVSTLLDRETLHRITTWTKQATGLAYTYAMLLLVFPMLATLVVELYVLIPLHTWKYSQAVDNTQALSSSTSPAGLRGDHTIRIIQAWTLGLLYLKLGTRILIMLGGRPALAVRAVLRRGWFEPDVNILTRGFVIPGLLLSAFLVIFPASSAHVLIQRGFIDTQLWTRDRHILVFRMSYPIAALCWTMVWILRGMFRVLDSWRARVRDEAYLMGERLHNFGGLVGTKGGAAGRADWRGSARL
ncbi:hypothetical protein JX265_009984 [Neoarthrinium moseri]|uniref:RING-type E3 ubiquitin transferase n=1 Tax=Neoarthrinium moseri TaxID=1658444 RepID=A0A9P9WEP8_9PEZI|nr:hypothetical protein JX265_009984 [Neoarthrinium moseri]